MELFSKITIDYLKPFFYKGHFKLAMLIIQEPIILIWIEMGISYYSLYRMIRYVLL